MWYLWRLGCGGFIFRLPRNLAQNDTKIAAANVADFVKFIVLKILLPTKIEL